MACCHDGKVCISCDDALRAERVKVLEEVMAPFDQAEIWQDRPCGCGTCEWCAWASRLFDCLAWEARSAVGMVDGFDRQVETGRVRLPLDRGSEPSPPVAQGRSSMARPPSEQPAREPERDKYWDKEHVCGPDCGVEDS